MITEIQLNKLKSKYGQIFSVEENGNINLINHFEIPQFKLIYVKGGEFMMGDNSDDDNKKHKVEVSSFFMAEFPVTQEIYKAVVTKNKTPSYFEGINHPVEQVSWKDAVNFCNILNKELGLTKICDSNYNFLDSNEKKTNNITDVKGFRLPTDAEWEFAVRGGALTSSANNYKYSSSNNISSSRSISLCNRTFRCCKNCSTVSISLSQATFACCFLSASRFFCVSGERTTSSSFFSFAMITPFMRSYTSRTKTIGLGLESAPSTSTSPPPGDGPSITNLM